MSPPYIDLCERTTPCYWFKTKLLSNQFIKVEISKVSVEDELIETIDIDELDIPEEKRELKVALKALTELREKQKTVSKLKSWHNVFDSNNILQDNI